MNKIIFIPTWRCNLKCEYCDYFVNSESAKGYTLSAFKKDIKIGPELTWIEWVEHLSKYQPLLLEMTGGEPTVYKDLPKLLKHIGVESRWAITSNTLLTEQIEQMPAENCLAWTASYHYHSDDKFMRNLKILKDKGINVRVTIVITPENYQKGFVKTVEYMNEGFGINIHPLLKQGFDWNSKKEDKAIWQGMVELEQASHGIVTMIKEISDHWKAEHYPVCQAGTGKYFMAMPDGQVFRCYSQILTGKKEGMIETFVPNVSNEACNMDCMFPCDREIARTTPRKVVSI